MLAQVLAALALCALASGLRPIRSALSLRSSTLRRCVQHSVDITASSGLNNTVLPTSSRTTKEYFIYQLRCKDTSVRCTYVGMTTEGMSTMLSKHRANSKINTSPLFTFVLGHGGWGNWEHFVLDVFSSSNITVAKERKKFWISFTKADLNKNTPNGTRDWRKGGAKLKEWGRRYYSLHKASRLDSNRQYKLERRDALMKQDRFRSRDYYRRNRESVLAKARERYSEKITQLKLNGGS